MISLEELPSALRALSSSSGDVHDRPLLQRLANGIVSLLHTKCNRLISSAGDKPIMATYMSDGWSSLIRTYQFDVICGIPSATILRQKHEFLNERTIYKTYDSSGKIVTTQLIDYPRKLDEKKGWNMFTAACDFQDFLPAQTSGIAISVYLQDGLMASVIGRHMRARHALYFTPKYHAHDDMDDSTIAYRRLFDWNVDMKCADHSCSSSLKWGMLSFTDADVLSNVHMGISSLIRGSEAVHSKIDEFLQLYFQLQDMSPPSHIRWDRFL